VRSSFIGEPKTFDFTDGPFSFLGHPYLRRIHMLYARFPDELRLLPMRRDY